jgi:hypothetical protein
METPIIAALTATLVSGAFTVLNYYLVWWKENQARKQEAALRNLQRQIEELYSPLLGLIQYGAAVNEIERQKLPHGARGEQEGEIMRYFRERYYLPLNAQMSELIRTKIYLLDSDALPESFQQFLVHAAQFECFHSLWKDKGISTDEIEPITYPETFRVDVEDTLHQLRRKYRDSIKRIGGKQAGVRPTNGPKQIKN